MYQGKVKIGEVEVVVKGSQDTCRRFSSALRSPYGVESLVRNGSFTSQLLFGKAWGWGMFPEKHAEYLKELAAYEVAVAAGPREYTKRNADAMPSTEWVGKYIPTEDEVKAAQEAAKTPEQRAAALEEKARRETEQAAAEARRKAEGEQVEALKRSLPATYPTMRVGGDTKRNTVEWLRLRFPGYQFRVSVERDRCTIGWTDGPAWDDVRDAVGWMAYAHYDGMHDGDEAAREPWGRAMRLLYSVFYHYAPVCTRTYSRAAFEATAKEYGVRVEADGIGFAYSPEESDKIEMATRAMRDTSYLPVSQPVETTEAPSEVSVTHNQAKDGIEIRFTSKPAPDVLEWLKANGYRWGFKARVWYTRYGTEREVVARARFLGKIAQEPAMVDALAGSFFPAGGVTNG